MSDTPQMHRPWVGSLLSLLLSGAGIFLAGQRRTGLKWFSGLTALWLLTMIVAPLPRIPALLVIVTLSCCGFALLGWMLVRSYRPIPKLGLKGWVIFIVLAIAVGAAESIVARQLALSFKMPTSSMETTLIPGDRLFAQSCAYWFSQPKRGDIVVFKTDNLKSPLIPKGLFYIKRLAALPGERIEIIKGYLVVNGKNLENPRALAGDDFTPSAFGLFNSETNYLVLPADGYFVVGDNHENSLDSRHFGAIPRQSIVGKATKIYWPLSRAGDIQ